MLDLTDTRADLLEGLRALDEQLAETRHVAVERAVIEGATEARTNHRFQSRTGATVDGIRGYVMQDSPTETTGVLESTAETSVFLNDGTKPHDITVVNAKALDFQAGGQEVFVTHVHHPGTDADPFFDRGVDKAEEVLVATMDEALAGLLGEGEAS